MGEFIFLSLPTFFQQIRSIVNKIISIVALVVALAALGMVFMKTSQPVKRVAYVRTAEVVDKYEGMMVARQKFQDKKVELYSNLDSLKADFQKAISDYNLSAAGLSKEARAEKEKVLQQQEYNIRQYTEIVEGKEQEEDQRLTSGVINQINSFIAEYGKENDLDLILGSVNGTVIYGSDQVDVTDEVLVYVNQKYRGE